MENRVAFWAEVVNLALAQEFLELLCAFIVFVIAIVICPNKLVVVRKLSFTDSILKRPNTRYWDCEVLDGCRSRGGCIKRRDESPGLEFRYCWLGFVFGWQIL